MDNIRSKFCPKCGAQIDTSGICNKCKAHDINWVNIPQSVTCVICPTCGSTKVSGIWSDCTCERDDFAYSLINNAVSIIPSVTNIEKKIDISHISNNRSKATITISGLLYNNKVETSENIKIIWSHEQCDRCSRIAGNYYEGIIQLRALNRKPTEFENRYAQHIAYQLEDQLQNSGDRLSFISDIEVKKEGLDIIVGSQTIGQAITHDICNALGRTVTTHPQHFTEKAGVKIYRITYSIRLPRFSRGDIIHRDSKYYQVNRQIKDMLFVIDLSTGKSQNFKEKDDDVLVSNIHKADLASVIYCDAGIIGILVPNTNEVREIKNNSWLNVQPGDNINIIREQDTIILIGHNDESTNNPKKSNQNSDI
ncbi:MAG TPA: 60S ribosomal export protein NMD3 [Methanocorpusculum sp.]|nr:60S ribosomal export protein NMD3 [Methanocorpusculum sp.]